MAPKAFAIFESCGDDSYFTPFVLIRLEQNPLSGINSRFGINVAPDPVSNCGVGSGGSLLGERPGGFKAGIGGSPFSGSSQQLGSSQGRWYFDEGPLNFLDRLESAYEQTNLQSFRKFFYQPRTPPLE